MKVVVGGSRSIKLFTAVEAAILKSQYHITELVSGGAAGVDSIAEEYAYLERIPVKKFIVTPEEWTKSRGAGHKRNERMVIYADAVIAVWDGISGGTRNLIQCARKHQRLLYIHKITEGL